MPDAKPVTGDGLRECATAVGLASASGVTVATKWARAIREAASTLDAQAADLARYESVDCATADRIATQADQVDHVLGTPITEWELREWEAAFRSLAADLARLAEQFRDAARIATDNLERAEKAEAELARLREPVEDEVVGEAFVLLRDIVCGTSYYHDDHSASEFDTLPERLRTHARQQAEEQERLEGINETREFRITDCMGHLDGAIGQRDELRARVSELEKQTRLVCELSDLEKGTRLKQETLDALCVELDAEMPPDTTSDAAHAIRGLHGAAIWYEREWNEAKERIAELEARAVPKGCELEVHYDGAGNWAAWEQHGAAPKEWWGNPAEAIAAAEAGEDGDSPES